ncbi:MAG: nicotinamide phosphoribosyltransferase domain-containing protein, partial [Nitrososphaera sp.]|nr:nicotinamide phosphoribosyltransferase domain-containing protein [Nitrososphaera sp.]
MNRVPWPLRADAYTVSGEGFAGARAKQMSVYNMTNRIGPRTAVPEVAQDNRMVFYGLSEFIRRHMLEPITHADIDDAKSFMETAHSFGGPLYFPEKMWRDVVDKFKGLMPLSIHAIPEGSTFFPGEPVVEVRNTAVGYGELAAHVEAVMVGMVSTMSARVTLCRHWLERIRSEFI